MSENLNYPYSYLLKTLIWISIFVFVFNMDIKWLYSNLFQYYPYSPLSKFIQQKSDISDIIRIRKNKVPTETI
jgi:hypothetical protein